MSRREILARRAAEARKAAATAWVGACSRGGKP